MKTLADFKRALTIGSRWKGYNHILQREFAEREVSKVNTKAFYFKTINYKGETVDSCCDFPKASNIEFLEDGTVNLYGESDYNIGAERIHERKLMLSYTPV